jgi:hypothetical protein
MMQKSIAIPFIPLVINPRFFRGVSAGMTVIALLADLVQV